MPWLQRLARFDQYSNKAVLEVGCGAGFDAYEFCRAGANYVGIDITPENVHRTRQHLGLHGFAPDVREGDAEHLAFEDMTFDLVYSNGVLHHTPDITAATRESFRVLRPGGEVLVALYHRDSIFYWITLYLVDHLLRGGFRRRTFSQRLAMIEYTTSDALPIVHVYNRRQVVGLLQSAGFVVERTWVHKLARQDLPAIPLLARFIWPRVPQRWLDRLGPRWGWCVIARARKPS